MARMVREKVATGQYASESEVIRDGLRALQARDAAVEHWLQDEVVASCRELEADPSQAIPASDVLARIKARAAGDKPA
jgi:putative addiction module CopG family antidote